MMNEAEQALADELYAAVQKASNFSDRSLQSKNYQVGVSDLGFCSEYTKRMLKNEPQEYETDALAAFIGTAVGDHVETAVMKHLWPDAICQSSVTVELIGDSGRVYNLGGHPDILLPEGKVFDVKTVNGLDTTRRIGPRTSQQFQRHCYAKGAHAAGHFNPDVKLEDVQVANIWIDRSGVDHEFHIQMESYSEQVVQEAAEWLDDVVYAYLHDEEARKEPSREFCEKWCGYYPTCRALDTDVEGLLTDPEVLMAVQLQQEANELERRAKRLKAQAKGTLVGVQGSTGEFAIRWVHVNGGEVSYTRSGYDKLDIRRIK
jgi:hypothetical protein